MGKPDPVPTSEHPTLGRTVLHDQVTGLPVIRDADMFFAYCAEETISDALRDELVETAAAGPMRRYGQFTAAPVDDDTWFTAALGISGLSVKHLLLFTIAISEGPSCDLGRLTRRLVEHPACTDEVVCQLIRVASYRKNRAGESEKLPSILAELDQLDQLDHPAAVAWRLSMSGSLIWEPNCSRLDLVAALRTLGSSGTRAADRLGSTWTGDLGHLLEVAAAVGSEAGT